MVGIGPSKINMTLMFEKITSDQFFHRIIATKADALVKISTDWSGSGQMLCHSLQDLAAQYTGKVDFFSVDHEAEKGLGDAFRIDTIPTLLFFKKGTLVDKLSGLTQKAIISDKLNQLVNS